MKKSQKSTIVVAVLLLAFSLQPSAFPQSPSAPSATPSPTAAPITLPPDATVKADKRGVLTPAQVQAIAAALSSAGVPIPAGMKHLNFDVIPSGTNAGGASYYIRFQ